MRELGEYLRREREERGITLDEIQSVTKIRLRYLEALEQGDFHVIPGQVYVRGFLQNYASFIGLDPAEILARYDAELRASMQEADAQPDGGSAEPPPAARAKPHWRLPALIGGAILLIVAAAVFHFSTKPGPAEPPSITPPAEDTTDATEPPRQEEGLSLVLRYSARCWVRIHCDGNQVFEATVDPGTVQEWRAERAITGIFGNAGAVEAVLNGIPQPSLGATGVTVTKEFRRF